MIKREILLTTFLIYIIFVAALTIMPLPMTSSRNPDSAYTNFIPLLNSIKCFLPNQTGKPEMIKFCLENIDVAEGGGIDKVIESVLIGDEDSLFHKRIRFNLEPQLTQAGLN